MWGMCFFVFLGQTKQNSPRAGGVKKGFLKVEPVFPWVIPVGDHGRPRRQAEGEGEVPRLKSLGNPFVCYPLPWGGFWGPGGPGGGVLGWRTDHQVFSQ